MCFINGVIWRCKQILSWPGTNPINLRSKGEGKNLGNVLTASFVFLQSCADAPEPEVEFICLAKSLDR
jgi:hypothetical protein